MTTANRPVRRPAQVQKQAFRVFLIESGKVSEGVQTSQQAIAGGGFGIDVLAVGERGRGRKLAFIPVQLIKDDEKEAVILAASLGSTTKGSPKLFEAEKPNSDEFAILVLRTKIGFRGGNSHTGDRTHLIPEEWEENGKGFLDFPGEILETGRIAQGDAGGMGSGEQLIVKMPKKVVFRTAYSGRLYGAPSAHYYMFDGNQVLSLTWEERVVTDLF